MEHNIDLILKGGRIVDPGTGFDGVADVAIAHGRIAAIDHGLADQMCGNIIDCRGKIVTAGLIDTHGHVFQHVTGRFGLAPDEAGIRSGVTTIVDQGGPSCMTLPGFRHFIAEPSRTRVLCFISAYLVGGLEGHYYPTLYGPEQVDVSHTVRVARANPDLVRGIKAHAEVGGASRWGLDVIKLGKQMARETGLPLYIHLGQLWPERDGVTMDADALVRELVPLLDPGDILAHPFTRHPGGFVSTESGEVHPVVAAALDRGVTVDVGHGSHFSFAMARKVLAAGIKPHTLGADMHGYTVRIGSSSDPEVAANPFAGVAPFSLTHAMSELLALGLSMSDVVATVTCNPARMLGLGHTIGTLAVGRPAEITVLDLLEGAFALSDNSGETVTASQLLRPVFALKDGMRYAAESPLVPPAIPVAA